jgi:hypothetical protein
LGDLLDTVSFFQVVAFLAYSTVPISFLDFATFKISEADAVSWKVIVSAAGAETIGVGKAVEVSELALPKRVKEVESIAIDTDACIIIESCAVFVRIFTFTILIKTISFHTSQAA